MMAEKVGVPVIWSDEYIIVIDKPAGLLAISDGYDPAAPHVKSILSPYYEPLWIVHRLDRFTSGVMVLARSTSAHRQLNTQFQERQVKKTYLALVVGDPDWDCKVIDQPLRENVGRRHRTVVDQQNGKPSVTRLKVLDRFGSYCLIEASPETGRRHQIRAHLSAEGLPIACDSLYGSETEILRSNIEHNYPDENQSGAPVLNRPALHARSIELEHPITHKRSLFEAPNPRDITLVLDILRGRSRPISLS
jgi:RluA family pseudouridine synthase